MLPHATALLQQPRMPPTGARQAIEVQIRWREAYAQYQNHLSILSEGTGHSVEKLDYDMQRYDPVQSSWLITWLLDKLLAGSGLKRCLDFVSEHRNRVHVDHDIPIPLSMFPVSMQAVVHDPNRCH